MSIGPVARSYAWGDARDALAAVHNLETLVRSSRVPRGRVLEVIPELFTSCASLREAFDGSSCEARSSLRDFARSALAALEAALRSAQAGDLDVRGRIALEHAARQAGADLDAATELLELAERAERHASTEHSVRELARVTLSLVAAIRPQGTALVKLDPGGADATVLSDAHVLSRLLVHAATWVKSHGAEVIALRTRVDPDRVRFVIEPASATDEALIAHPMVTLRRVAPTDAIVLHAVAAVGAAVEVGGGRGVLTLPRAA